MPNDDQNNSKEEDYESLKQYVEENFWKLRHCDDYENEYTNCKSVKGRFHQYFVHGEFLDCNKWKEDYKNCEAALDDVRKCAKILQHEDERMQKRLENHLGNDVWKRRDKPPENWNSELPEFMRNRQEDFSIFEEEKNKFCVIS